MLDWIPASERPQEAGQYLVVVRLFGGPIVPAEFKIRVYAFLGREGSYCRCPDNWTGEFDYVTSKVVAWMPLPKIQEKFKVES